MLYNVDNIPFYDFPLVVVQFTVGDVSFGVKYEMLRKCARATHTAVCLPTLESAAECIGGQGHGGRNLLVDGGERGCKGGGWGERGDASFHFLPTSLLLTDIVLSKQQIVWPWASSVHFIANSASAENGFNLFLPVLSSPSPNAFNPRRIGSQSDQSHGRNFLEYPGNRRSCLQN